MNRTKRLLTMVCLLPVLLIGLLCLPFYRQLQQQRKDQALIAAIKVRNVNRVRELLEAGANANAHDTGAPPSFRQVVRQFLTRWRHPAIPTEDSPSPSALVLAIGTMEPLTTLPPDETTAIALLDHGAKPDEAIISSGDISVGVLTYTCHKGSPALIRKLLSKGVDPNRHTADQFRITPLMWAESEATKILIVQGADVNAVDRYGNTALEFAEHSDDVERVRILLKHGAKIPAKEREQVLEMMRPGYIPYRPHSKVLACYGRF